MTRQTAVALPYLTARKGVWHYQRRVPREVAHLDPRPFARKSTGINIRNDPTGSLRAGGIAAGINTDQEQMWADLLAGRDPEVRKRTIRAVGIANALNIPYRAAEDVAVLDVPNILKRTDLVVREQARVDAGGKPQRPHDQTAFTDAVLGGTARSGILMSGLFEKYFPIVAADHRGKSENQLRVWKNRKKAAAANFIKINGDMDMLAIETQHRIAFRDWWSARILDEGKKPGSANKDIGNLKLMIATVCKQHKLVDPEMFTGIGFKKEKNKRKAFKAAWVLEHIWPEGSLSSLNREAYDLTIVLTETGARPIEICALNKRTIFLDANIPFIRIIPENQELKSHNAKRDVPLVGRALEVMRRYPNGFPRYHLRAGNFCATVNKQLRTLQSDVNEAEGDKFQTIYCLRHLFKDRLRHARVEDEMKNALMGHEHEEDEPNTIPSYGEGFELQHKLDTLQKIAFPFS